jgi:hypothetical protein
MSKTVGRVALLVAALASLFIVRALQPSSIGVAMGIAVWLLLPYAALAGLFEARSTTATATADVVTTLVVAGGGLLFLILVVFVKPDPQGAIAVLFTPVYQGIATAMLLPVTRRLLVRPKVS